MDYYPALFKLPINHSGEHMQDEGKIFTEQRVYKRGTDRARKSRPIAQPHTASNHWLLKSSLLLLLVSILIWGWLKLTNPENFPIYNVQIRGNYVHVDHNNLRQTIVPFIQKGFLMMDTRGLQDRLLQLPWVATAKVQRIWPDKIIIYLTEQHPVARFGKNTLLNAEGELFTVKPQTVPAGLPLLMGPLGQQKLMLDTYQAMHNTLTPLSLKATILVVDPQQFWRLQLDNGIVLLIGKTDPIARLQRFVAVYPQVVGDKATLIDYIDLRYSHGMAIHFKNQNITKA